MYTCLHNVYGAHPIFFSLAMGALTFKELWSIFNRMFWLWVPQHLFYWSSQRLDQKQLVLGYIISCVKPLSVCKEIGSYLTIGQHLYGFSSKLKFSFRFHRLDFNISSSGIERTFYSGCLEWARIFMIQKASIL